MNNESLIPQNLLDGDSILRLERSQGEALFQTLTLKEQVQMITFAASPEQAEELIYLLPDASNLIKSLPAVNIAMIIDPQLEVNPVGILPHITPRQLIEIADRLWWTELHDVNHDEVVRWLSGISLCSPETAETLIPVIADYIILIFHNNVKMSVDTPDEAEDNPLEGQLVTFFQSGYINISDLSFQVEDLVGIANMLEMVDSKLAAHIIKRSIMLGKTAYYALVSRLYAERAKRLGFENPKVATTEKDLVLTAEEEVEL